MKKTKTGIKILSALLVTAFAAPCLHARKTDMVSVSADIVEISGNLQSTVGFSWYNLVDFAEKDIPGILSIGQFERKTALSTRLSLMESEGKAQILSNPKIVTKTGTSANISVGGQIPLPEVGPTGSIGTSMQDYGIILSVMPTIIKENNNVINLQVNLEVSEPDYSHVVVVGASTVPSFTKRKIETQVELNSGETLVIGGLKSSQRNVAVGRIPFLGKLPLLGWLFRSRDVREDQSSLFLFVTVEIVE